MTHTPGPWKAITGGADAKVVCPDGRSFLIGDIIYHDENKSNARLIAAAPDLLAACQLALVELDRIGSDIGFEPDRYQERINALDALSRATRKAGDNNG